MGKDCESSPSKQAANGPSPSHGEAGGDRAAVFLAWPAWRGLVGLLLLLAPWPTPPALLLGSCVRTGWPLGRWGVAAGLLIMGWLMKAPTPALRYPGCAALGALAAAAPPGERLGAAGAALFVTWMIRLCNVQQRPWPAVLDILTNPEKLCAKAYFRRCEVFADFSEVKQEKSFFAFHPHGVFSAGWTLNAVFDRTFLKGVGSVTFLMDHTLRHKNPLFKVMLEWCQTPDRLRFESADKKAIVELMSAGANVALIPGGFQDATVFSFGRDRIVIKERKGFIKYCLQYGYRVHPVYTFGESDTYYQAQGLLEFRLWLNGHGVPTIVPFGWPLLPLLPRPQAELLTFVGEALELPHIAEPTKEQVDEWHGRYVEALRTLFESKKAQAGRPRAELETW